MSSRLSHDLHFLQVSWNQWVFVLITFAYCLFLAMLKNQIISKLARFWSFFHDSKSLFSKKWFASLYLSSFCQLFSFFLMLSHMWALWKKAQISFQDKACVKNKITSYIYIISTKTERESFWSQYCLKTILQLLIKYRAVNNVNWAKTFSDKFNHIVVNF